MAATDRDLGSVLLDRAGSAGFVRHPDAGPPGRNCLPARPPDLHVGGLVGGAARDLHPAVRAQVRQSQRRLTPSSMHVRVAMSASFSATKTTREVQLRAHEA